MKVIEARNVNSAFDLGLDYLKEQGLSNDSRNGEVLVAPTPVTTVFEKPQECILFYPLRDANPFFHLFEAIWMLAGRNDVAFPGYYAKQLKKYSDDGVVLNGAYGHRWRQHFGYDQLECLISELKNNSSSRRGVLSMWDPGHSGNKNYVGDLVMAFKRNSKDVPCNTCAYFSAVNGTLDMTVSNRSNDIIWGAYGANVVHFSILLQFIASATGMEVGRYYQISNNYHIYTNRNDVEKLVYASDRSSNYDYYSKDEVRYQALFNNYRKFDEEQKVFFNIHNELISCTHERQIDLNKLLIDPLLKVSEPIFKLALPLLVSHRFSKLKNFSKALGIIYDYVQKNLDWQLACSNWLSKRQYNYDKKLLIKEEKYG